MSPSTPTFRPNPELLAETLTLAVRYNENRGVFFFRGHFYEERVKPRKEYLWTTAEHLAKRLGIAVLEEAA